MFSTINDKRILITGGSRGIGLATAKYLAECGATVISTSRSFVSSEAKTVKNRAINDFYLDVRNEESILQLFTWIQQELESIDVLINNAGIGIFKPIDAVSLDEWTDVIETNLTGSFLCAREAFKLMKKNKGGRIINIGSVSDYIPLAENGVYAVSKFGLRGLNGILNEDGKKYSIRSTLLSLGAVYTEIWNGREGFNISDMLDIKDIVETIVDIITKPLNIRIDLIRLLPSKGIL